MIQFTELTPNAISNVMESLASHELVQLRLGVEKKNEAKQLGLQLAEQTQSDVVQILGHTILLFRAATPPSRVSKLLTEELANSDL